MNWDKAKNLTIMFLLLVNVFLGALVLYSGEKYTLTQAQEDAILNFLTQNKVSLYTTIPREFRPKPQIRVSPYSFDADRLVAAFWGTTGGIKISLGDGSATYTRDEETLVVKGDTFSYENPRKRSGFVLSRDNAVRECNKFLGQNQNLFGSFTLDRVREVKNGYMVNYCGLYGNYLLASNTLSFLVTSDGIAQAECRYNHPIGYDGADKEIISPDEALYIFVNNMNYLYGEQEIFLDSMELLYFQGESTTDTSIPVLAAPYYRFTVFSGDAQVMVNAYTGIIYGSSY